MKKYLKKRNTFVCPRCGEIFEITSIWRWLAAPHIFDIWRYVKCPECEQRSWMKRVKEHDFRR